MLRFCAVAVALPPGRARALDDAIRAIPADWFKPSPLIYWSDLAASAAIGWTAFVLAVVARGWTRAALLLVATCALYRAVLFIHEITHLNARDVPGFRVAWNAIVGVPLLIPSFLYEGVHTDHHRQRCYGTDADPEYVPYGRKKPIVIVISALASLLAPIAFAFRFAILTPVSWVVPSVGRATRAHASALVINTHYQRQAPLDRAARIEEAAAFAAFWTAALLVRTGALPLAVVACWAIAVSAASFVNAVRTFAAHRYDNDEGELTMVEQLLDSCTIAPGGRMTSAIADACRTIVAPVGLRFHALHHWIPSLPYHNLGRAHRRLTAALTAEAPYRTTIADGFTPVLRDLIHRSRTQSS
jgi:fatty acid desaturase